MVAILVVYHLQHSRLANHESGGPSGNEARSAVTPAAGGIANLALTALTATATGVRIYGAAYLL